MLMLSIPTADEARKYVGEKKHGKYQKKAKKISKKINKAIKRKENFCVIDASGHLLPAILVQSLRTKGYKVLYLSEKGATFASWQ